MSHTGQRGGLIPGGPLRKLAPKQSNSFETNSTGVVAAVMRLFTVLYVPVAILTVLIESIVPAQ